MDVLNDGSLTLRPLTPGDIDLLPINDDMRALFNRIVERNDWTYTGTRALVAEANAGEEKGSHTFVGYVLVGLGYPPYFPALSDDIKQLYLASIQVFEPFQRRGFGLRMMQLLRTEAQRLEVQVFRAECAKGWLVTFYERVGFKAVPYKGPREDYPQDEHQMLEMWLAPTTN
jgi:GNAT superfamily N-acetyltransferase